ncbi:MAG: cobalt ECF transporter T component CbiQ [Clostridium sp.]
MKNGLDSIYSMRFTDDLAQRKSLIHELHPTTKLITTIIYIIVVISFDKYEVSGLLSFILYPVVIISLGEIPPIPIIKKILIVEPFIIGIGILNLIFNNEVLIIGEISISMGWIMFLSIFIKSTLTVMASILLIATTGMDKLAMALRMLKVPKIFVLQLLLTYRYISVLMDEVFRMINAYALRAPGQRGIHLSKWGTFLGQLILRSFDRAERVYQAMELRGFKGEYNSGNIRKLGIMDFVYLSAWSSFFIIARIYNISMLLGSMFRG